MSEPAPARSGALTGPVEVVGAGLLGTSIALALPPRRPRGPAERRLAARTCGPPPASVPAGRAPPPTRPQLVVVAVPPDHLGAEVARALAGDAVVTDVGSIKTGPWRAVADLGRGGALRRRAPDGGQRALRPARRQRRAVRRPALGGHPAPDVRPGRGRAGRRAGPALRGRAGAAHARGARPGGGPHLPPAAPDRGAGRRAGSPTRRPSTWRCPGRACATSPGSRPATPRCGSRS